MTQQPCLGRLDLEFSGTPAHVLIRQTLVMSDPRYERLAWVGHLQAFGTERCNPSDMGEKIRQLIADEVEEKDEIFTQLGQAKCERGRVLAARECQCLHHDCLASRFTIAPSMRSASAAYPRARWYALASARRSARTSRQSG